MTGFKKENEILTGRRRREREEKDFSMTVRRFYYNKVKLVLFSLKYDFFWSEYFSRIFFFHSYILAKKKRFLILCNFQRSVQRVDFERVRVPKWKKLIKKILRNFSRWIYSAWTKSKECAETNRKHYFFSLLSLFN